MQPHPSLQNDMILGAIFTLLPLEDLQNARLSCKHWAKVGARELTARTVVCLTDSKFAGSEDYFKVKLSFMGSWECHCFRMRYNNRRFASVDSPNFRKLSSFDSELMIKSLIVYGSESILKLAHPMFSRIESLVLLKIPYFQVTRVLEISHTFFKNLKRLELRDIEVEAKFDENAALLQRSCDPDENETGRSSSLQSLALEISPHWIDINWSFLRRHTKLNSLEINWWMCNLHEGDSSYYYGRCLETLTLGFSNVFNMITHLNLRFQPTEKNAEIALVFLNKFSNLMHLSLQVERYCANDLEKILIGLKDPIMLALDYIHVAGCITQPRSSLRNLLCLLGQRNFFKKQAWKFFWVADIRWFRLSKTSTKFTIQLQASDSEDLHAFPVIEEVFGRRDYFPHNYNYANHHIVRRNPDSGFNDFEILNENTLFKAYLLVARWKAMKYCVCDICSNAPRLLADMPGFQKDTGHVLSNDHPNEPWIRTWTFLSVPRAVLAHWRIRLVDAIAEARVKNRCQCEWSDVVTRMKQGLFSASAFTDPYDRQKFPEPSDSSESSPRYLQAANAGFRPYFQRLNS